MLHQVQVSVDVIFILIKFEAKSTLVSLVNAKACLITKMRNTQTSVMVLLLAMEPIRIKELFATIMRIVLQSFLIS